MSGPLAGIRILDLTTVFLGPYCTQLLGDLGADIIKVEPPEGDSTRFLGPSRSRGMGGTFLNLSRNKRSCVLDLTKPQALSVLQRIVSTVDVMVYNMRPAAMQRLGISYEWASAINPKLIYCGGLGFGEGGPYSGRPAFDDIIQAASGLAAYQQHSSGRPAYCATAIADKVTALFAANAILAALFERQTSGRGQKIDVPMFETMVGFALAEHMTGAAFEPPLGPPRYSRILSPNRRPYQTADGYIAVLPYNDRQWAKFFKIIGQAELAEDSRFGDMAARTENIDVLYEILAQALLTRTSSEWLALLGEADIPSAAVAQPEDLVSDPHLKATGFFEIWEHESEGTIRMVGSSTRFSETKPEMRTLAPRLGQHTVEVLEEAGFSAAEIAGLQKSGVARADVEISNLALG
ncbi:CaiB/BaiF CoA transferase family protein [Rhodoligotrophos defluvii]|uniref:CaiB/BaiF CoA transferase family protein n=1 Tax=Rhodoligotrophos defluvii TaxID=2561934 RepID=UPI0010C989D1|nr:CoA transferase [Rhodoligotrophos defluvii]